MPRVSIGAAFAIIATTLAHPALAQVVYKGDDALRLKCATILAVVSSVELGESPLRPETQLKAMIAAEVLLAQLPGRQNEKAKAMRIMADRFMARNTPDQILVEFERTLPACERFF
ncbi:MAG: hypothetical protein ACRCS0_05090 [Albidovulum sp.]